MDRIFNFFWIFAGTLLCFTFCSQADRISLDSSSAAGILLQGGMDVFRNGSYNPSAKEITSFRFKATDHFFTTDFVGTISGNQITIRVPFGSVPRLKATFENTGIRVQINGVTQTSGQTVNDFSSPLTYRVTASDGSVADYGVQAVPIFRLTDAGQPNCYATCSTDPGQDADYSTGVIGSFQSNYKFPGYTNNPVTIDGQSGLIWKYCAEGMNDTSCGSSMSFTQYSAGGSCNDLNSQNGGAGYAGITHWRLPNLEELMTLSTFKTPSTVHIDLAEFPGGAGEFWTSFSYVLNTAEAWSYDFSDGFNSTSDKYWGSAYARCVSGGSAPTSSYSDLGNGTIQDNRTGLIWQKCSTGQNWSSASPNCATGTATTHNFSSSLATCRNLNLAGRSWRLPNVHELRSLLDFNTTSNQKIDSVAFPNTPNASEFTTSNSIPGGQIYRVNFTNAVINLSASSSANYVRCVSEGF
ncbi:DUF1566 domain-containing protein [Leptospira barantonii]|uniref:Adhesin n=1 Tax=Leptospira barantonii TaxID=2023184 RepID=A0ABX4NPS6_9LEPT|nr:DUF1566 domain-containing protein [Leptospira barantonii]PJZ57715.1 adhesin [Leptospira barantonii]